MALPPVPNLDPDSPEEPNEPNKSAATMPPPPTVSATAATSESDPSARATLKHAPIPDPEALLAVETAPAVAEKSPSATHPPAPPPETPQQPPGAVAPAKPERRETGVVDSIEEVLQQASEQTLHLSHLEDAVNGLSHTLNDFQDEMHAGFAEIRAVTETTAASKPAINALSGRESLTERLDFVEEQSSQSNKRQGLLTVLAIVQVVLLVGVLAMVLWGRKPTTELPPPAYREPARVEPSLPSELPTPNVMDDPHKKKRRKRLPR